MLPESVEPGGETKFFYNKKKRTFRVEKTTGAVAPAPCEPPSTCEASEDDRATAKVVYPDKDVDLDLEPECSEDTDEAVAVSSGDTLLPGSVPNANGEVECFDVDSKLNEPVNVRHRHQQLLQGFRAKVGGLIKHTHKTFSNVVDTARENLKSA